MRIKPVTVAIVMLISGNAAVHAADLSQINAIVNTTTPASDKAAFVQLESDSLRHLRSTLQGDQPTLLRARLEGDKHDAKLVDRAWIKASGYDFAAKKHQQAGIALLEGFSSLPDAVLKANLDTVTRINNDATTGARQQALADAESDHYLYFLVDALGPRLGEAFLTAYDNGELKKAAALINASEISTGAAKDHFNYPRPFQQPGNAIRLVPDSVIVKDQHPYTAGGAAFPSGHTNTGYTDALLMAEMLPERFVPLVDRGARFGYSRVVLGVHYPLDVIGSRMVAQRNVAFFMNDPAWRKQFDAAKAELRAALTKACGMSLAECARSEVKDDPYRAPEMKTFYRFTMTYNLPRISHTATPVVVAPGAEVLLEPVLPQLSAQQRRQLMEKTALENGYALSATSPEANFWQRLNLHDAATAGLAK